MSVIVASPAYPRPPIDGDKVRWSSLLQELARLERLDGVFGFMPTLGEIRDPTFEAGFASVAIVPTPNYEVSARAGLLVLRGRPSAFGRRATPSWQRAVAKAATRDPGAPLLLLGTSGGFIPSVAAGTFLDLIDVRSRVRIMTGDRLTSQRVLAAELRLVRRHRLVLACESDRRWLIDHGAPPTRISIVTNGVDTRLLTSTPNYDSKILLFVGSLRYPPNLDGLDWFLRTCWPPLHGRHPDAILRVVGYGAERVRATAGVEIHADVPDVRPHYAAAALSVAPIRSARGVQNKVLEAMAASLPVVATSPVAGGLFADHPLIVADEPQALIGACTELLGQPSRRVDLGRRGLEYVRRHHDWAASAAVLRELLLPV